jgi:hypothetical protein
MMSSIEVAWKPSREKHLQALVRMCWRRWARVVSLSLGIAKSLNKNGRVRYTRLRCTLTTNREPTFLFGGGYAAHGPVAITLNDARTIVAVALEHARSGQYPPMTVAVLDTAGELVAFAREDGSSLLRGRIATGKARALFLSGLPMV